MCCYSVHVTVEAAFVTENIAHSKSVVIATAPMDPYVRLMRDKIDQRYKVRLIHGAQNITYIGMFVNVDYLPQVLMRSVSDLVASVRAREARDQIEPSYRCVWRYAMYGFYTRSIITSPLVSPQFLFVGESKKVYKLFLYFRMPILMTVLKSSQQLSAGAKTARARAQQLQLLFDTVAPSLHDMRKAPISTVYFRNK